MNDECTHKVMTGKSAVQGIEEERGESREKIRLWMCICDREYREYRECGSVACLSRSGLIPPCENSAENEPMGVGRRS